MEQAPLNSTLQEELEKKEERIQQLTQQLEDVKNFMESTIQSIASGILITESNDTITYINRAGERILGYPKEEVIGKPFSIFNLKEKQSVTHSLLDNPDDLDTRKEGWMRRKDHSEFPIGFTMNNHLNVRGESIGTIVIFRDMTNVYKIQEEILRMDRLISLGKLASGIAHELRNPLAGGSLHHPADLVRGAPPACRAAARAHEAGPAAHGCPRRGHGARSLPGLTTEPAPTLHPPGAAS